LPLRRRASPVAEADCCFGFDPVMDAFIDDDEDVRRQFMDTLQSIVLI
jgi:hypothetical protein